MKETVKNILKKLGLYYFLQGNYRNILSNVKRVNYKIQYEKYKGAGFDCNCCGVAYSKFVPDYPAAENAHAVNANEVIAGYGENILCPACLSTARELVKLAKEANIKFQVGHVERFNPALRISRWRMRTWARMHSSRWCCSARFTS